MNRPASRLDPAMPGAGSLEQRLHAAAQRRRQAHGQRHRRAFQALSDMRISDGHQAWINFSSNDYLGLASAPSVIERMAEAARQQGLGSGASALVTGYHPEHQLLERELADYLQRDAVLLCSSGYLANACAIHALVSRGDTVVQDRLCHASLIDAARSTDARLRRYQHIDIDSARQQLATARGLRLLVTDGVFSMDGDQAPLRQLVALAQQQEAALVVDDAHGIGVLGPDGRGLLAQESMDQQQVPVLTGTLGKAFGASGAFVAGSKALIDHLVNEGRGYVYNTAMPPALAAAARQALNLVRAGSQRRARLRRRIAQLREGAHALGLELLPSSTAIQPLLIGDARRCVEVSQRLARAGFWVVPIRPPTVREGTARLRITLTSEHRTEQVDGLLEALSRSLD